jgi:hypothetical protein
MWYLILRYEQKLRVYVKRVLRRIFWEPRREEEVGSWSTLHKQQPYNLHASPNISEATKSRIMR